MKRQIIVSSLSLVLLGIGFHAPANAGMYVVYQNNYPDGHHYYHYRHSGYYDHYGYGRHYGRHGHGRYAAQPHGHRSYSSFPSSRAATGRPVFIFNPRTLSWGAYNGSGELVKTGPASGGRGYCSDIGRACHTPVGTFHVYDKEGASFVSSKFPVGEGGAPMPYAMFFHGGFAVHGSYEVRPYNASHGCIRITPGDAAWLNHNLLTYGSTVIVMPY